MQQADYACLSKIYYPGHSYVWQSFNSQINAVPLCYCWQADFGIYLEEIFFTHWAPMLFPRQRFMHNYTKYIKVSTFSKLVLSAITEK